MERMRKEKEKYEQIEKNVKKAVSLLQSAAIFENAYAEGFMGICYEDGLGVKKNEKT